MSEVNPVATDATPAEMEMARLRHEIEMLTSGGIIEVAVRNPNVADYMRHWEGRAEKAEAFVAGATDLLDAALGMRRIVEEIDGALMHGTWRDANGARLKDTPEWVALYNSASKAEGRT